MLLCTFPRSSLSLASSSYFVPPSVYRNMDPQSQEHVAPTSLYKETLPLPLREIAIKQIKDFFESRLSAMLRLRRITAPLFVTAGSGLNDDLNGVEKPISFKAKGLMHSKNGDEAKTQLEIVQSLAKWKRVAVTELKCDVGHGIYADMNAIRPDEDLDATHSIYVDQWDWCKCISEDPESGSPWPRALSTLKTAASQVFTALQQTEFFIAAQYPNEISPILPKEMTFVTSQELLDRWPSLTPKEREDRIVEEFGAVFLIGIGGQLSDGSIHDGRAPDYDDWTLNGDILVRHPILGKAFELSSMGIRVDSETLRHQVKIRGVESRLEAPFHQRLLKGELKQTMGGGIGQSRLCMLLLRTAHIGEVSSSAWPQSEIEKCEAAGIELIK